ncbi:hypothetical protein JD844_010276, partial [Phrynosoma platyrhinos]
MQPSGLSPPADIVYHPPCTTSRDVLVLHPIEDQAYGESASCIELNPVCLVWMPFLLLGSVIIIITAGTEKNFVRIWPEKPVVEFGGSVVLNCSSNCQDIGLQTSLKWVLVGTGTTEIKWKAFNLTSVDKWAVTLLCNASCATGAAQSHHANFTVYRVPEHVVLDPVPKMEVGKEYNLICRVPSVAPIQNLTVTLFKGGKELQVKTFENFADPEAREVVVTHAITVQKEDHGEEVTCQAALDLRPEGPLFKKTSPSESLTLTVTEPMVSVIPGTSEEVFEVILSPQMVAVKQGVSVWLNCSFTCKYTPTVRLETSLRKGRVLRGPGWVSTQIQNIREQASLAHCYCTCEGKTKKATATILTYEQVDMLLQKSSSSQSLHQAYNLTCRVIRITPVHNLTVTLLKGTEKVHSWKLRNITRPGPQSFNVTHVIVIRPHDHGKEADCRVTLNHNADEQTLIATSSKLELKTP